MTDLWQNLVIIFLIFVAIAYLVLYLIKSRRAKKACENCALYKHADKMIKNRDNQSPVSN